MKTILIGLNELNFTYIEYYISKGLLPNFKKYFETQKPIITESENKYELLEPWIQWVTIYTGKTFNEHKVFRLGDIINKKDLNQIFEEIENNNKTVGLVSPFNADNRLKKPAFFIPDPWTKTKFSGNFISKKVYQSIAELVNNNARSKFNIKSLFFLALGFILYVPLSRWFVYLKNITRIKMPGIKAVILDSLLIDIFIKLEKKSNPDFSHLFLNSGAHIQHHYLFNSIAYKGNLKNPNWYCPEGYDPLIKILTEYDNFIGRISNLKNTNILLATGLHQVPHKHVTFYWRLNNHEHFIKKINIKSYLNVLPRMSRDFLINFNSPEDALFAQKILDSYYCSHDNQKFFKIDNRKNSLFVELIYASDIGEKYSIYSKIDGNIIKNIKEYVSFVAIKNGEHNGNGYISSNFKLNLTSKIKLTSVKSLIINLIKK